MLICRSDSRREQFLFSFFIFFYPFFLAILFIFDNRKILKEFFSFFFFLFSFFFFLFFVYFIRGHHVSFLAQVAGVQTTNVFFFLFYFFFQLFIFLSVLIVDYRNDLILKELNSVGVAVVKHQICVGVVPLCLRMRLLCVENVDMILATHAVTVIVTVTVVVNVIVNTPSKS